MKSIAIDVTTTADQSIAHRLLFLLLLKLRRHSSQLCFSKLHILSQINVNDEKGEFDEKGLI